MKITIAALKKIIAEGIFKEGLQQVNEAAIADLYDILRGKGKELSSRLKKAKRIKDPVLQTVEVQARDLVTALHAVMNAASLRVDESVSRGKNYMTKAARLVVNDQTADCVLHETATKNPCIITALACAEALNKTLRNILTK